MRQHSALPRLLPESSWLHLAKSWSKKEVRGLKEAARGGEGEGHKEGEGGRLENVPTLPPVREKGGKKSGFSPLVLKGTTCPCLFSDASSCVHSCPHHSSSDLATCLTVIPSFIH